jgi:hypothetical protein
MRGESAKTGENAGQCRLLVKLRHRRIRLGEASLAADQQSARRLSGAKPNATSNATVPKDEMIGTGMIAGLRDGPAQNRLSSQDLASRYLELAAEARAQANRTGNAKIRTTMMEVAATWERLAHLEAGD